MLYKYKFIFFSNYLKYFENNFFYIKKIFIFFLCLRIGAAYVNQIKN